MEVLKEYKRIDMGFVVSVGEVEDVSIRINIMNDIINCKKRFFIIPVSMRKYKNNKIQYHANFLIYDSKSKEIERFEPYGQYKGVIE